MSYSTWHNYGYGICVDQIKTQDVGRLKTLLKQAPKMDQEIHNWLAEVSAVEPGWEDYMEFDQDYNLGLATILQRVIEEVEGLCLTACDDCNSTAYLIYQPRYPWELSEKERELTKEKLDSVFRHYVGILVDEELESDDQSVENGG